MIETAIDHVKLCGYIPDAIARITELHATYYSQHWQLGLRFEAEVAAGLAEFLLRFNPERDGFWLAVVNDKIVGSIAIDGQDAEGEGARLRWFIVDPNYRGIGMGQLLMQQAVEFCQQVGIPRIYLWTFAGLSAARHLYDRFGFVLQEEFSDDCWGAMVKCQKLVLIPPHSKAQLLDRYNHESGFGSD